MQRSAASFRFERRLARRSARPLRAPAEIVGVEMEFEVVEAGRRLDFRDLIDEVVGGGDRRWFPMDPHARYLPSGAIVTCDGMEAEIATPPVRARRGHPSAVADEMLTRRAELDTLVRRYNERTGRRIELRGYSTHLNAFLPEGRAPDVAVRFARTVAPAMMLLLDLASSPGALVRPRGRRLELGGEYVAGRDDLRAALTYFIAATMAVERGLTLPLLDGELAEDPSRGGWFVARTAFGEDLYVEGRMASLRLAGGGRILAGTLLGETWEIARPLIEQHATEEELAMVDDTVAGARALPLEREPGPESELAPASAPVQPFARILDERRSNDIGVKPETVSWEAATLKVTTPARSFYARVPLESYAAFATLFERGALDKALRSYGARPPRGRIAALSTPGIGLYDAIEGPAPATAGGKAPRITIGDAGEPGPAGGMLVTVAKRAAVLAGAAAMFAGTAAFAYLGLRQAGGTAAQPKPRPETSVLAGRESREPVPTEQSTMPTPTPTTAPPSGIITLAPTTPPPVVVPPPTKKASSTPTPRRTTSQPQPSPTPTTSKPKPSSTPTPTPTPTQSQGFQPPAPPPPQSSPSKMTITGRMACNSGTSYLSFSVAQREGGTKIVAMDIQYNSQHLASSPAPSYPYSTYSGTVSSPTGGNKRWYVVVQDQSGAVETQRFDDIC
ncbi:MAG TPA: hypothetical protein VM841_06595 [Actinomycetota bacterium]|nr:hypothetical protein [Actinomycetota bacterium]